MTIHLPHARETMLWRRVGTLAWIMGARKTDNPFQKYLSLLDPQGQQAGTWGHKMRAWDQGWEIAAVRAKPGVQSFFRSYLPTRAWSRLAILGRDGARKS